MKKKIGSVGVDSGQLMIIDPRYIETEWDESTTIQGIDFWGEGQKQVKQLMVDNDYEVLSVGGKSRITIDSKEQYFELERQIKDSARNIGKIVVTTPFFNNSYDRSCDVTSGEDQGGQLDSAVVFTSGFGDGVYDVIATYENVGDWGERITKVEIILNDEKILDEN